MRLSLDAPTLFATAFALACAAASTVDAQSGSTTAAHGGQTGPDLTLEAIEPADEAISVGLAGDDPADIARYLLAMGAGSVEISPDGATVAFSSSVTGAPQLWTVPAEGGSPRQLTFGNGVTFFAWASDGSGLIYGADNDGNEQEAYYLVSADGSREELVLAASEGGFRVFGDWNPDSQWFAYASTERNGLDFDIRRADRNGENETVFEGRFGYFAEEISPDGAHVIVTESVGEDSDNLHLLDVESGEMRTLSAPEPRANHGGAGFEWAPDGSGFYFASNVGRDYADLLFYDLAADEMRLVEDAERDVAQVALCGPDGRYLVWTTNEDGFYRLHARDLTTRDDLAVPDLPEGVYGVSCARDAARAAIRVDGWRTPGDIVVWDLESGAPTTVYAGTLAGLDPERLVQPISLRMTARDGVELQGLLYLPDESSRADAGPPPVLFNVHGGPTGQSMADWNPVAQYHVDRGVAVFEPNVRGSTGFGRVYVTLDDREKRLDSVRDLVDMLDALKTDGRVDADRAAVAGGSYGGYMVNAVLAAYPDAFDAGVALYGVADWVTALEIASPALKASDRIEYGDITEPRWRDFYTESSPIRQADRIRVPVLYSHGVMDPRIDIAETEVMVRTLRDNGVEAVFIRIPDEGHGWRKLENRLFYYRREAAFIAERLGR